MFSPLNAIGCGPRVSRPHALMPYWRLCSFYLLYFAALGVLAPYWSLYLQSLGFGPIAIGQLIALFMVSRIVAPNVWGWVADHYERRMHVVRLAAALTVLSFLGVFVADGFWSLAIVMLAFSFFWNAPLPLLEVNVMNHVGKDPGAYGRVRLWGSLGFIIAVVVVGAVIERHGPRWIPLSLLTLMCGIWLFCLALPDARAAVAADSPGRLRDALWRPEVAIFLVACFLMQVSHGPYYTFYSIYLDAHGYSKTVIGVLWGLGVACEIGVFLIMPHLLRNLALRRVLLASFALATLRWLLIGYFPEHLTVLALAQALHAATFGAFHAVGVQMVHRFFTGRHQHRGQAIYGSASFGVGGVIGSLCSGYTWTAWGPSATFALAATAAGLAFAVAYFGIRPRF